MEFIKQGSFSPKELEALVSVLQLAGGRSGQNKTLERKPKEDTARIPSVEKSVAGLESLGVRVYGLDRPLMDYSTSNHETSWDTIAGYDQQKRYAWICGISLSDIYLSKSSVLACIYFLLT